MRLIFPTIRLMNCPCPWRCLLVTLGSNYRLLSAFPILTNTSFFFFFFDYVCIIYIVCAFLQYQVLVISRGHYEIKYALIRRHSLLSTYQLADNLFRISFFSRSFLPKINLLLSTLVWGSRELSPCFLRPLQKFIPTSTYTSNINIS